MANTEVGSAYVSIMPSMKGFQKEVGGVVESTFGKVRGIVAGALATGAIAAFGKAAVDAYADYEQLVGGVDTLFKDASADVQKYASKAYKTAGLSANAYMEQATSFSASLLQSLGGDTKKAADYADRAIVDMSDNANKMGSSMRSIQDAYQGFAKQNYTMLDNLKLGYGGTKGEMERLIADANRVKRANGEMADLSIDSFADVTEAIHIIQTEMGITGTTALEAEETITGSVASMKSAWENWLTGLGDSNADMRSLTDQLVDTVVIAAGNVIPRIGEIVSTLARTVAEKAPEVADRLGNALLDLLPETLSTSFRSAVQLWNMGDTLDEKIRLTFGYLKSRVAQEVKNLFTGLGLESLGTEISDAFNSVMGAVTSGLSMFSAAFNEMVGPALEYVKPLIDDFLQALKDAEPWLSLIAQVVGVVVASAIAVAIEIFGAFVKCLTDVINWVTNTYNNIKHFVDGVYDFFTVTVPQAISDMQTWFQNLPGKIAGWLGTAKQKVADFANNVKQKALDAGRGFLQGVSDGMNSAVEFVKGIPQRVLNALGNLGGLLVESGESMLRGLADGIRQGVSGAIDAVKKGLKDIRSFFPFSPAKRGPFSGHGWVLYSGISIAEALGEGFHRAMPDALDEVEDGMSALRKPVLDFNARLDTEGYMPESRGGVTQNFTFNQPIKSPDEVARSVRMAERYGFAADY